MLPQSSLAADIFFILLPFLIAFFSKLAFSASVYVADSKLVGDAQNGNKKAEYIMDVLKGENSAELSIRLLNVFCMSIAGFSVYNIMLKFIPQSMTHGMRMTLFLVFALLFPWVFWSLSFEAPKALSAYEPEKFAYGLTFFLRLSIFLTLPARLICRFFTAVVILISGNNPKVTPNFVTEEEIRLMVDEGEEKGTIENMERRMINNVFEFDDHDISEVMTHRKEVAAVPVTAGLMDVIKLAKETGYSRIAVYEEDIDNICGFAYIKDLLKYITSTDYSSFDLKKEIRKPIYLPEGCSCADAFSTFKKNRVQIAVVVDEYGGTYGIVTMEDLLETVFGNIQDEYDNEKMLITDMGGGNYLVDASYTIPDLEQFFDVLLPDHYDSDTVGGLVTEILGQVPDEGDELKEIEVGSMIFKVVEFDEKRITKIMARLKPEDEE